jgi:pimeloyl-ACP methyl ester carboxylesterase
MTSSYLLLNDLRFHYLYWNREAGGRPLVLLHGLASNARIWELVAPYLAEKGMSAWAPDARGHGLTDKPDEGYDFATITADLAAFISACRLERPVLVGHSWGAMVALDYASHYAAGPAAPAGIILVDGGVTQMDDQGNTWEDMSVRLAPPRLAGMALVEFQDKLRQWTAAWEPAEQALDIIQSNFEISEEETIAPRLSYEHHMRILRSMWDFKTYAYYARLRCPALAIPARPTAPLTAQEQSFLQAKERGIAQAQANDPRLQVHWMDGSIHDIPLQRPRELAALISAFVDQLP